MKKGGARVSGIITLLLSVLILCCSVLFLGKVFSIAFLQNLLENQTVAIICKVHEAIFVMPFSTILNSSFGVDIDIAQKIMAFFNMTFYLLGVFWGIKEITLAKKSDEKYAKCYHTCGFALLMKILTVVYFLYVFTGSFYDQNFIATFAIVDAVVTIVPNFTATLSAVLAIITFVLYIIPQVSFLKAKQKFQEDKDYEDFMAEQGSVPADPNVAQNYQYDSQGQYDAGQYDSGQYNAQGQYDAGQYVIQGQYDAGQYDANYNTGEQYGYDMQGTNLQTQYQQNPVEPLNPQAFTQNPNRSGVSIIPGQNGVPYNITPKGIEDLARLERLRSSGAIDEQNYFAMRKKVCQINVSPN